MFCPGLRSVLGQQEVAVEDATDEVKDLRGLHDVNESARLLGKSHWWLRKLAKRGRLGFIRVGRQHRLMFPVSELLKLLEAQKNNK